MLQSYQFLISFSCRCFASQDPYRVCFPFSSFDSLLITRHRIYAVTVKGGPQVEFWPGGGIGEAIGFLQGSVPVELSIPYILIFFSFF